VLDERGYVPASKVGSELLFEVIGQAYERQSLVVTTNLAFEKGTEVLGSERLTGAALDRLTHRCHILEFTVESYRLQCARRRWRVRRDGEILAAAAALELTLPEHGAAVLTLLFNASDAGVRGRFLPPKAARS